MSQCLFCRIINGEIPADVVLRNDAVVAFRDIKPQAPVHVLIVPTAHVPHLLDPRAADGALLASVLRAAQELAGSLGLEKGFRVVANHGEDGGQTVGHIHFHLLGRRAMGWPPG